MHTIDLERRPNTVKADYHRCEDNTLSGFTYRDLEVWQAAMELVEACYRATASFPQSELYGLTSQIRRAAVSIPSNIAEGHCRRTTNAYRNHVSIALGSHGELETCIDVSCRLGMVSADQRDSLLLKIASVGRMLNGLHRSLGHVADPPSA